MDINKNITTPDEARQYAIDWQNWQATQALSMGEMAEWANFFAQLASRFNLTEEFHENGII